MPTLTIIRGLPGTGKSQLAKSMNIFHLENDMFSMVDGVYEWSEIRKQNGINLSIQMVEMCLKNGNDCVISNVFFDCKSFSPFINLAILYKAKYKVILMTKIFGDNHNVPIEVKNNMFQNWEKFESEIVFEY